jgi:hypothetical protein
MNTTGWPALAKYHSLSREWKARVVYDSIADMTMSTVTHERGTDDGTFDGTAAGFRQCVQAMQQQSSLDSAILIKTVYSMLDAMCDGTGLLDFDLHKADAVVVQWAGTRVVRIQRRGGFTEPGRALFLNVNYVLHQSKMLGLAKTDNSVAVGLMLSVVTVAALAVMVLAHM